MAAINPDKFLKRLRRYPFIAALIIVGSVIGGLVTWSSDVVENALKLVKFFKAGSELKVEQRRAELQAFRLGDDLGFVAFVNRHKDQYLASPGIKSEYDSRTATMKVQATLLSLSVDLSALNLIYHTDFPESSQGFQSLYGVIDQKKGQNVALGFRLGFLAAIYYWILGDSDFDSQYQLSDFADMVSLELNQGERIGLPKYELPPRANGTKVDIKLAIQAFQRNATNFLTEAGR
jgi:hypothetical protein